MRVLFRTVEDKALYAAEVLSAFYYPECETLVFSLADGTSMEVYHALPSIAENYIRSLYDNNSLDMSQHLAANILDD